MNPTVRHEQIDDAAIARSAEHWLRWSPSLAKTDIHVTARDGRICLSGTVAWEFQRLAAESAVRHILGVAEVRNELHVDHPGAAVKAKAPARKKYIRLSSFSGLCDKAGTSLPN